MSSSCKSLGQRLKKKKKDKTNSYNVDFSKSNQRQWTLILDFQMYVQRNITNILLKGVLLYTIVYIYIIQQRLETIPGYTYLHL